MMMLLLRPPAARCELRGIAKPAALKDQAFRDGSLPQHWQFAAFHPVKCRKQGHFPKKREAIAQKRAITTKD